MMYLKQIPEDCFDLSKMFRPYVMQQNAAFHLGIY